MTGSLLQLPRKAARLALKQASYSIAPALGSPSRFAIHAGYRHRDHIAYFDDTENSDNWQREVYETARDLAREEGLKSVYDVGCGSGYKLVHMLGEFDTTGIDLPETIELVRARFPERKWLAGSFDALDLPPADLVICSDVIEHVEDPDALMRFILGSTKKWAVLSTPDRDLVYGWRNGHRFGPPENPSHVREWTVPEFATYVGRFLRIERHFISNRGQATQCIVGQVRR